MEKIGSVGLQIAAQSPSSSGLSGSLAKTAASGGGFGLALRKALENVSSDQMQADRLQKAYQLGEPDVSLEEAMLATQAASVSFQGLVQVRNRLVSAYHDIMNMPV